jgi:hypothetical protein
MLLFSSKRLQISLVSICNFKNLLGFSILFIRGSPRNRSREELEKQMERGRAEKGDEKRREREGKTLRLPSWFISGIYRAL